MRIIIKQGSAKTVTGASRNLGRFGATANANSPVNFGIATTITTSSGRLFLELPARFWLCLRTPLKTDAIADTNFKYVASLALHCLQSYPPKPNYIAMTGGSFTTDNKNVNVYNIADGMGVSWQFMVRIIQHRRTGGKSTTRKQAFHLVQQHSQ